MKLFHISLLFWIISGPNNAMPGYQVTWLATYIPPPLSSSPVVATKILIKVKMTEMIISAQPEIFLSLVKFWHPYVCPNKVVVMKIKIIGYIAGIIELIATAVSQIRAILDEYWTIWFVLWGMSGLFMGVFIILLSSKLKIWKMILG